MERHPNNWPTGSQLVGISLVLQASQRLRVDPHYAKGLHAWFLDQIRQTHPQLSRDLHDGDPQAGTEKALTLSRLLGPLQEQGSQVVIPPQQPLRWVITALQTELVTWLRFWLLHLPRHLELRQAPLQILGWEVLLPPTSYAQLADSQAPSPPLSLTFLSPTSFRHRGHHLPLPVPRILFQSYLRRWNAFSGMPMPMESVVDQVDASVMLHQLRIESCKTAAGKAGSVTGFVGSIQLGFSPQLQPETRQHLFALLRFAPYCGTGHKTTFGLGQTRWGWHGERQGVTGENLVGERVQELTEIFMRQRLRQGGSRTERTAKLWATILARREHHESLRVIATDLEMPYETVETYVKLARRALTHPGDE